MKNQQIKHLADLNKLKLTSLEIQKLKKELTDILAYVNQIKKLKIQKIEPTSQVTGLENVLRADETTPSLSVKEALSGTKSKKGNFFKIKALFNKK